MIEVEGDFIPPPEAPVFEPTWEEFQDPLGNLLQRELAFVKSNHLQWVFLFNLNQSM